MGTWVQVTEDQGHGGREVKKSQKWEIRGNKLGRAGFSNAICFR